jgi:hypothetical protein
LPPSEAASAHPFGLFVNEREILAAFGAPQGHRALGGITIGYAFTEPPVRSFPLPTRTADDFVHGDAGSPIRGTTAQTRQASSASVGAVGSGELRSGPSQFPG